MRTTTFNLLNLDIAPGTHTITVVAIAEGCEDSEPSNEVTYTVED